VNATGEASPPVNPEVVDAAVEASPPVNPEVSKLDGGGYNTATHFGLKSQVSQLVIGGDTVKAMPPVMDQDAAKKIKDLTDKAEKYRERAHRSEREARQMIAYRNFKEGDLALFLQTRLPKESPHWAAFNIGAPYYFLRAEDSFKLETREWLVARIRRIEEHVVTSSSNPLGLSEGIRWYLLDAVEERTAPSPQGAVQQPANGGYPPQQGPPGTQPAYPAQQSAHGQQQPAYGQQQPAYGRQHQRQQPSYPLQQASSYPQQQPAYGPSQAPSQSQSAARTPLPPGPQPGYTSAPQPVAEEKKMVDHASLPNNMAAVSLRDGQQPAHAYPQPQQALQQTPRQISQQLANPADTIAPSQITAAQTYLAQPVIQPSNTQATTHDYRGQSPAPQGAVQQPAYPLQQGPLGTQPPYIPLGQSPYGAPITVLTTAAGHKPEECLWRSYGQLCGYCNGPYG
jgi:hypothetical protein